jgi:hypothetical protein
MPGVVRRPRGVDLRYVSVGPGDKLADGVEQGAAERGELVFHPGRDDRMNRPGHDAVAFQAAQGYREHPWRDAVDGPVQLAEPHGALAEQVDSVHRPLIPDALQNLAGAAGR